MEAALPSCTKIGKTNKVLNGSGHPIKQRRTVENEDQQKQMVTGGVRQRLNVKSYADESIEKNFSKNDLRVSKEGETDEMVEILA